MILPKYKQVLVWLAGASKKAVKVMVHTFLGNPLLIKENLYFCSL